MLKAKQKFWPGSQLMARKRIHSFLNMAGISHLESLIRTGQSIATMMYLWHRGWAKWNVIYVLTSFCPTGPERPGIYFSVWRAGDGVLGLPAALLPRLLKPAPGYTTKAQEQSSVIHLSVQHCVSLFPLPVCAGGSSSSGSSRSDGWHYPAGIQQAVLSWSRY